MNSFYEKLKAVLGKEFPDTENIQYHISKKLLRKYPWESKHIFMVHKTWRQQGKCFPPDTWWTSSVCFDDREQLGSSNIKFRISVLSIDCA